MENQNNQAQPQTQYVVVKKKSKAKWIILAIIAVIIIAAIGSGGGSEDKEPTIETIAGSGSSSSQTDNSENPSTKNIKPGSTVSDGEIKVSYIKCNTDFTDYERYWKPESGYKVIEVVFDFENTSDRDQTVGCFECYADGVKCETFYGADDYTNPSYESISAGRKLGESKLYYEVPSDAEKIELEYESDLFSNNKYIFIVE